MSLFRRLRDRLLGNPAMRDHIGRWPIGRQISAHHARRLFGTVGGFAESQMLAAAVELGVIEALHRRPCAGADWPGLTGLPARGAAALLQGLTGAGILERLSGDRIGLSIDGLVVATDPGLRAMIAHNQLLYADLAHPVAMLKAETRGHIAAFWPYADSAGDADGYARLMAASQSFIAESLMAAVDFGKAHHVMDIGGGDGRFVAALAERFAAPRLTLVDLPDVLTVARQALAGHGLAGRVTLHSAHDALPDDADMITFVRVLHDHDDESALNLLRNAARALRPGARLVIAEPMAQAGRDPQTAYFAAYFAAMQSGRLRTPAEIRRLLRLAGLHPARGTARPSVLLSVITATPQA